MAAIPALSSMDETRLAGPNLIGQYPAGSDKTLTQKSSHVTGHVIPTLKSPTESRAN